MRLCNGVCERNQHHFIINGFMVIMNTLLRENNTVHDTSFCDAITNIYDEMVLKIFIDTFAKRHVKRVSLVKSTWKL